MEVFMIRNRKTADPKRKFVKDSTTWGPPRWGRRGHIWKSKFGAEEALNRYRGNIQEAKPPLAFGHQRVKNIHPDDLEIVIYELVETGAYDITE
jgi:hypothetical protein